MSERLHTIAISFSNNIDSTNVIHDKKKSHKGKVCTITEHVLTKVLIDISDTMFNEPHDYNWPIVQSKLLSLHLNEKRLAI